MSFNDRSRHFSNTCLSVISKQLHCCKRINWTGSSSRYTPITRLYTRRTTIDLAQYYYTTHDSAASHDTTGLEYRDISLGTRAFRTCLIRYVSRWGRDRRGAYIGSCPYRKRVSPRNEGVAFRRIIRRDAIRTRAHVQFFYTTRNSEWKSCARVIITQYVLKMRLHVHLFIINLFV